MSQKGSAWERTVCKTLSLWWSGGQDDSMFWRTANSGGRATIRSRNGRRTQGHCGDICATCKESEPFTRVFTLELKRGYSKYTIADLLDRPRKAAVQEFEKWILQANASAEGAGSLAWVIIQRRDRRLPLVFFPSRGLVSLLSYTPKPYMILHTRKYGMIFGTTLNGFLKAVSPDRIKELCRKEYKRG